MLAPHYEQTVQRIHESQSKYILAIQDSMELNYTGHLAKTELGSIGKSGKTEQYGLIQHSTLCVTDKNEPLGLINVQYFDHDELGTTEHHHHRPIEEKESYRWLAHLLKMRERIGDTEKTIITVADREGDFFELLHELISRDEKFVIRSKHNRYTGITHRARGTKLRDYIEQTPVLGTITAIVQNVNSRQAETIDLQVKASSVTLPPPNKSKEEKNLCDYSPIKLNLIKAYNDDHEWLLLTTQPISTLEEIKEIITIYRSRWHIEDYHKVLKTGYQVDEVYLHSSRDAIENLLVMASISACRLYWLIYVGRADSDLKASYLFKEFEWQSIYLYFGEELPDEEPLLADIIHRIARLGGYKKTKKGAPPGIKTFWIGFQKFTVAANMCQQMLSTKT